MPDYFIYTGIFSACTGFWLFFGLLGTFIFRQLYKRGHHAFLALSWKEFMEIENRRSFRKRSFFILPFGGCFPVYLCDSLMSEILRFLSIPKTNALAYRFSDTYYRLR